MDESIWDVFTRFLYLSTSGGWGVQLKEVGI